jgi:hypothetical protein
VSSYQVDDLLEQLKLIFGFPYTAADDDAFPGPRAQGMADDRFHVVAVAEAEQAALDADAVLGESSYAGLDCVGYRLRVPGPGNPIRVKADHEDAGYRGCYVHTRNLTSQGLPRVAMWAAVDDGRLIVVCTTRRRPLVPGSRGSCVVSGDVALDQVGRVLDLYQRVWDGRPLAGNEYVISSDEKTSIQARCRRHPTLPPGTARRMRVNHEYDRGGAGRPASR